MIKTLVSYIFCILSMMNCQIYDPQNQTKNKKEFLIKETCSETLVCLNNALMNVQTKIQKCTSVVENCDQVCLDGINAFFPCLSNCKCIPDGDFPWSCYNSCEDQINKNSGKIIECLFSECRPSSFSILWIILIAIGAILIIGGVAFLIYFKFFKNKTPTLDTSTEDNAFNKISS